jgi:mannose-6-phosphate isomerase-like protein (cupin superfamily)
VSSATGRPGPHGHITRERDCAEERWGGIVSWRTLLSADRTATEALTVGTAEIQPGAPTSGARHRHAVPEVYYVITGTGLVHIDGIDHFVEPGTAVFIPGNAWHFVTNNGAEPLRFVYVFPVDGFDEVHYEHAEPCSSGPTA